MAESKNELVKYEVNQQNQQFEREVIVQAEQFMLLYEQIETSQQADKVAENGYQIALKQYQNGNLSITDLNIALQEREQSRRDYINSLAEFWKAYYKIRILTLYDFENDKTLRTSDTEK
jgi:outer membrane protein TolC